jgi:ABC-type multidrug transport system fused ATPase/permease subunit
MPNTYVISYFVISLIGLFFIGLQFFLIALLALCFLGTIDFFLTRFLKVISAYFIADIELKENYLTKEKK